MVIGDQVEPTLKVFTDLDPIGYVHSIDTGSMVDGPGMRLVLFLSGCAVHCTFCHNPDTWHLRHGTKMRVSEVLQEVDKYASFLRTAKGGVTISGGEPLLQAPFVTRLITELKQRQLHVTLETSGNSGQHSIEEILRLTDLCIVDVKGFAAETYQAITNTDRGDMLHFCKRAAEIRRPLWLSLVLIRNVSDNIQALHEMARWAQWLGNVERVLVRPLHLFGGYKWENMSKQYAYTEADVPSAEEVAAVRRIFAKHDLEVA